MEPDRNRPLPLGNTFNQSPSYPSPFLSSRTYHQPSTYSHQFPPPLQTSSLTPSQYGPPYHMADTHPTPDAPSNSSNGAASVSPTQANKDKEEEERMYNLDDLEGTERPYGRYVFKISRPQEPVRARMCGFGDKDRRPITPVPILQLHIVNTDTSKEIDYERPLLWQRIVLSVDLWSAIENAPANCVKPNSATPSIGCSEVGAFPASRVVSSYSRLPMRTSYNGVSIPHQNGFPAAYGSHHPRMGLPIPNGHHAPNGVRHEPYTAFQQTPVPATSDPTALAASKNLIGQSHTSGLVLRDTNGKTGLFFIFQDLSVRTEGWFRLKASAYVLGKIGLDADEGSNLPIIRGPSATWQLENGSSALYEKGPLVAGAFSKPFKVFSAKKFPGVLDTTELNKVFADQGVKIPIRKNDGKNQNGKRQNDDENAQEEETGE